MRGRGRCGGVSNADRYMQSEGTQNRWCVCHQDEARVALVLMVEPAPAPAPASRRVASRRVPQRKCWTWLSTH